MEMVAGLHEADVSFVVVGGVSARLHGTTWITDDLDICYAMEAENLRRLAATLRSWRASYRQDSPGPAPSEQVDEAALRGSTILNLRTNRGDLDVLSRVAGVGGYEACFVVSDEYAIERTSFVALDVGALVEAKRAAARKKDQAHLIELEALRAMTKLAVPDLGRDALYHRLQACLGDRLTADDALAATIGAFARMEHLERVRLIARSDPGLLVVADAELASLPPKQQLAEEIQRHADAAGSGVHRLSKHETAALRRALDVARRRSSGPRRR